MEKYIEILRKCTLFYGMSDENITKMLTCLGVKVKSFDKLETVISEGECIRDIGIVLCGMLQIERTDYYGNRSIVANVEASELFGEAFACADIDAIPVDVVAVKPTRIMFLECSKIMKICNNTCEFHHLIIYNLMKIIATKNIMVH